MSTHAPSPPATSAHASKQAPLKPEWLSVANATKVFGLSRSSLYELIANGTIKSRSLRKRGSLRGKRLISYDSLAAYIDGFEE